MGSQRSLSWTRDSPVCITPITSLWAGSSVGIATGYGLDGPGIESRWGRDFPHLSGPTLGPTQTPVQWVLGLSRGKERPGRDAEPSSLLVPWSRKSRSILLLPLWAVRPIRGVEVQLYSFSSGTENLDPTGIRSPNRPARSQSLYEGSLYRNVLNLYRKFSHWILPSDLLLVVLRHRTVSV